jgi:hypothetical protein
VTTYLVGVETTHVRTSHRLNLEAALPSAFHPRGPLYVTSQTYTSLNHTHAPSRTDRGDQLFRSCP